MQYLRKKRADPPWWWAVYSTDGRDQKPPESITPVFIFGSFHLQRDGTDGCQVISLTDHIFIWKRILKKEN